MLKVLITGSNGLIGHRVLELLGSRFKFIPLLHSNVDITQAQSVWQAVTNQAFDICLNLAAYTQVDRAEQEPDRARALNVDTVSHLLDAVVENQGKPMIHLSTDFVFDGMKQEPYDEDASPNPISVYGKTKHDAELLIQNKAMIVRLAYPYGFPYEKKADFIATIKRLLQEGKTLNMVEDSTITPTFIDDLVLGLGHLLEHYNPGIYHLVGGDSWSPYQIGLEIANFFHLDNRLVKSTSYAEYFADKAQRPRYSTIISRKNNFQPMLNLRDGIKAIYSS